MTLKFKMKLTAIPLFLMLGACSGLSGDKWPSLATGFETRQDPSTIKLENPQTANQGTEHVESLSTEQQQQVASLQKDISEQKQKYLNALDAFNKAEQSEKARHWFTAQLELTRISAIKTSLASIASLEVESYLQELEEFLNVATQKLMSVKP